MIRSGLVVPDHATRPERHAADLAAARAQIAQHLGRRKLHLLAQPFCHHSHADEGQQIMRVRAQAAAVERGENAGVVADLGVVDGGVRLMPIDVQGAAAGQVERRERMLEVVVAAAHDRALAALGHDEGQRGFDHLAVMDRDAVLRRHVDEHAAEPVVGDGGEQVRRDAELGAAERRRDRIAAERHRIVARHRLLVAGRDLVGEEGDVDVALADEQSFHVYPLLRKSAAIPLMAGCMPCATRSSVSPAG